MANDADFVPPSFTLTGLMRRIGLVENSSHAELFCDYLVTLGIHATSEQTSDSPESSSATESEQREIWVKDERKVDAAKTALDLFLLQPDEARYLSSSVDAAKVRAQEVEANKRRLKNVQPVRHRSLPGLGGGGLGGGGLGGGNSQRPVVALAMVAICVIVGLLTNFGSPRITRAQRERAMPSRETKVFASMTFLSPDDAVRSSSPFTSILKGEVWRLITPAFLHAGILHLAMNMMAIFGLGGAIERTQGRFTILLLIIVTAIAGTVVQALWPEWNNGGPGGIGASGVAYGLIGYIWVRPYYDPDFQIYLPSSGLILAMLFLLLGLAEVVPRIANGAHVGGLACGILMATLVRLNDQGSSKR